MMRRNGGEMGCELDESCGRRRRSERSSRRLAMPESELTPGPRFVPAFAASHQRGGAYGILLPKGTFELAL